MGEGAGREDRTKVMKAKRWGMSETYCWVAGYVLVPVLAAHVGILGAHALRRGAEKGELNGVLRATLSDSESSRDSDALRLRGDSRDWVPNSTKGLPELRDKGLSELVPRGPLQNMYRMHEYLDKVNAAVSRNEKCSDLKTMRSASERNPVKDIASSIRTSCLGLIEKEPPEIMRLLEDTEERP